MKWSNFLVIYKKQQHVYNVTYETLGKQEIKCSNCGSTFEQEVIIDDTMHEDSITLFEEEEPFNKFTDIITIPMTKDFTLEFTVGIPSMADFNRILSLVPTAELQSNLENIKSQFNTEQLMTLYTRKLAVYPNDKPEERAESSMSQEILSSVRDCVNIEISNEFFRKYAEKFSKYNINFYQECECPHCKEKTRLGVDIEYHFFLKQLPR